MNNVDKQGDCGGSLVQRYSLYAFGKRDELNHLAAWKPASLPLPEKIRSVM